MDECLGGCAFKGCIVKSKEGSILPHWDVSVRLYVGQASSNVLYLDRVESACGSACGLSTVTVGVAPRLCDCETGSSKERPGAREVRSRGIRWVYGLMDL
ncbi:hypothetical protein L6452_37726 [Arctium lappa]|uniref:Uncharacterized protein n=1 Tax=Arctium lappa TaxID=4217 RepID=A0ACB8Y7Y0_ARCLA|nr:hypothetical protein L6452_37726 [Arctium lappa]